MYSTNGVDYFDEDAEPEFKPETGTPVDVDYISGLFGDRHDPDGNFGLFVLFFSSSFLFKKSASASEILT